MSDYADEFDMDEDVADAFDDDDDDDEGWTASSSQDPLG
jgi:hypothetical protein